MIRDDRGLVVKDSARSRVRRPDLGGRAARHDSPTAVTAITMNR
jgi:hypothetical protein